MTCALCSREGATLCHNQNLALCDDCGKDGCPCLRCEADELGMRTVSLSDEPIILQMPDGQGNLHTVATIRPDGTMEWAKGFEHYGK